MKNYSFYSSVFLFYLLLSIALGCTKDNGDDEIDKGAIPLSAVSSVGEGHTFGTDATYESLIQSDVVRVTAGNTSYFIGYRQVSANNQDPIIAKYVDGQQAWVRTDLETSGDDSRGYGVLWDGAGLLYMVFTTTGTQGAAQDDFRQYAENGWQTSYGQGGGAKAAIIAKINPATGEPLAATFAMARKENGNANSLIIKEMDYLNNGNLKLRANAWFSPLKTNKQRLTCQGDSPFDYTLELSGDLSYAAEASAPGCE